MISGFIVFLSITAMGWLLLPRVRAWYERQTLIFTDRMRWHGVQLQPNIVYRWLVGGTVVAGMGMWLLFDSIMLAGGGAVLVGMSPGWAVSVIQARRRQRFGSQFVDVLLLMSNSLRAGFNLSQSLQIVATEMPSPSKNEFALVIMDRELGASMENALENLGRRMKSDSVDIFITALLVTMQTGGDISRMLDKLVKTIRDRERVEDRVKTMTADGRMQGYVVSVLPVLMFLAVFLFNPEAIRDFMTETKMNWGLFVIVTGVVFNVVGLIAISRMSKVKV